MPPVVLAPLTPQTCCIQHRWVVAGLADASGKSGAQGERFNFELRKGVVGSAVVFLCRQSPVPLRIRVGAGLQQMVDLCFASQVPFPVTAETAGKVLELLGRKAPDQELKLSADGKWEVPRILPVIGGASVATETEDVRLQVGRPGQLSSLHWHPLQADFEDVREDEVQVQVSAVSMHFKDVMLAMGMLGDFKPIIGMECAGTVTRVGSGVKNFKIGDQVWPFLSTFYGSGLSVSVSASFAVGEGWIREGWMWQACQRLTVW